MRARYLAAAALALLPTVASASETITYSYDAKGRLTQVVHNGGPQKGAATTYAFDAADNRTNVTVSGAVAPVVVVPVSGAVAPVVVVPLNGFTVIPLNAS